MHTNNEAKRGGLRRALARLWTDLIAPEDLNDFVPPLRHYPAARDRPGRTRTRRKDWP